MGETPAATVSEIEATRNRLEGEVRQLEAMLPRPVAWGKRIIGALLGGGALGTIVLFLVRRRRSRKAGKRVKDLDRRLRRLEAQVDRLSEPL